MYISIHIYVQLDIYINHNFKCHFFLNGDSNPYHTPTSWWWRQHTQGTQLCSYQPNRTECQCLWGVKHRRRAVGNILKAHRVELCWPLISPEGNEHTLACTLLSFQSQNESSWEPEQHLFQQNSTTSVNITQTLVWAQRRREWEQEGNEAWSRTILNALMAGKNK